MESATKRFDHQRPDFTPYGFACELWEPVQMRRPDRHNEIELNLLSHGTLAYLLWGRRETVRAGRLAAFWGAIPHQIVASHDLTVYHVATVPLAWLLSWQMPDRLTKPLLNGQIVQERDDRRAQADWRLFEGWQTDLQSNLPIRREIVLLELKARLMRLALDATDESPTKPPAVGQQDFSKVEQMVKFIAENYTRSIKVGEIGQAVGLNCDYAANLFRKTFGLTPNESLIQHRILHAQRMLVTTDDKILGIAMSSGFNSLSRFNAAFKVACGCTPRQYRAKHRL